MTAQLNHYKSRIVHSTVISLIFIYLIGFSSTIMLAQTGTVSGRIIDKVTNAPIAFANVIVDNTLLGSTTDIDGKFTITKVPPAYVQLMST